MQLSKQTIAVLSNFSDVNPNCLFREGSVLSTVNEAKSFVAEATIPDTIDTEFGIYNLKEFLSALKLVDDPSIDISKKTITIKGASSAKVKYGAADPAILTYPPADGVNMPEADIELTISADVLNKTVGAASTLIGSTGVIRIYGGADSNTLTISAESPDGSTRNSFSVEVEATSIKDDIESFVAEFPVDLFKMVRGDYNVKICRGGITQWDSTTEPIKYWLATNQTSKFETK